MSDSVSLIVAPEMRDKLVSFVHAQLSVDAGLSKSKAKKMIQAGDVKVNDVVTTKCARKLRGGDIVVVQISSEESTARVPLAEDLPIEVIYEDAQVLIVNKPCGMIVHPSIDSGQGFSGSLVNALLYRYAGTLATAHDAEGIRPGIVHRLDRDTSGLLCVARTDAAFAHLQRQFMEHSSERTYVALVKGRFAPGADKGTINEPIGRHPNRGTARTVVADGKGRTAVTHWTILKRFREGTLVQCKLETGRTHQIRVHMKHIKHPLFCDAIYSPGGTQDQLEVERKLQKLIDQSGQYLHAIALSFNHPQTDVRVHFKCDMPRHFQLAFSCFTPL